MLTSLLMWLLIVNNHYVFNHLLLMLLLAIYFYTQLTIDYDSTYMLFNSHFNYDNIIILSMLVGCIISLTLISFYGNFINNQVTKHYSYDTEFLALLILLIIAMSILISMNSTLGLLIGIELQSLVLYILLATKIHKHFDTTRLSKISLSYLVNAAAASGLLVYGIAISSTVLILLTIIWKLGIIPLHAWSLPILDNQNNIIVSIYLTITKIGTLLSLSVIASQSELATTSLLLIGCINLLLGNVLGLLQIRYQRIIVYSSMIQIGYILLLLGTQSSIGLIYFETYVFYTVLLLLIWILPTVNLQNSNNLLPMIYIWTMIIILYTVSGLPYMPLFWMKLDILLNISSSSLVLALLSTLLSSLIYVRLIKYITFYYKSV